MLHPNIDIQIEIHKFEDLLANDNLFVDYFNTFLALPSFTERLIFNYESGDLEVVEKNDVIKPQVADDDPYDTVNANRNDGITKRILAKREANERPCTAMSVKRHLEYNIKSFIDQHANQSTTTKSAGNLIRRETRNHSFRAMQSIPIRSRFESIDIKDPVGAAESRKFVINTKYEVQTLEKPKSIKWLRVRRLTLFLQSIFYSEYKLSKILLQCKYNQNGTPIKSNDAGKFSFVKVEIDEEINEMDFNPFKAKTELQKLREQPCELSVEEREESASTSASEPIDETSVLTVKAIADNYKRIRLFNNDTELYRALKYKDFNTTLMYNETAKVINSQLALRPKSPKKVEEPSIIQSTQSNQDEFAKSVPLMPVEEDNQTIDNTPNNDETDIKQATNRVNSVKISEVNTNIVIYPADGISDDDSDSDTDKISGMSDDNDSESCFGNTYDRSMENMSMLSARNMMNSSCNGDFELDFEDEDKILKNEKIYLNVMRKESMESFKAYLKDTDGDLYLNIWLEIEQISTITNTSEQTNLVKQLKTTFNRPETMKKLSKLSRPDSIFSFYGSGSNDQSYWSLDNLRDNVQPSIVNALITYWFPKYLIHLNFKAKNEFIQPLSTTPLHHYSSTKMAMLSDLQADNIQKSIKEAAVVNSARARQALLQQKLVADFTQSSKLEYVRGLYRERKAAQSTLTRSVSNVSFSQTSRSKLDAMAEDEFMDIFKTHPPIAYKRPVIKRPKSLNRLTTTMKDLKGDRLSRAVYYEAISSDNVAGNVFLKYLQTSNKKLAINRLCCLQELTKYKELFYDNNFNRETVERLALRIYGIYIAISATSCIECDKKDRISIHNLVMTNQTRPFYEDTFDAIVEFLFQSLYAEWNEFQQTEKNFFKKIEILKIERNIKVKSKRLEELKQQGLVKFLYRSEKRIDQAYDESIEISKTKLEHAPNRPESTIGRPETNLTNLSTKSSEHCDMYEFSKVKRNLQTFKKYLEENNGVDDLFCWLDIESYCQINEQDKERMNDESVNIKRKYLSRRYLFGPRSPIDDETQNAILESIGGWNMLLNDRPLNSLILLAKNYSQIKLENYWLPKYFKSDLYKEIEATSKVRMADVVRDAVYLRNKSLNPSTSQPIATIKDRWAFSSQAVMNFRKALRNPFTVKAFESFLAVKAAEHSDFHRDKLMNNLQFLTDVTEYKELHQKNADVKILLFKVKQIVDSYVNNDMAPRLLIDIPRDVASRIVVDADHLSPYLFHEANLHVFHLLLPLWLQFDQLRCANDLENSKDFLAFKSLKKYENNRQGSANGEDDHSIAKKWRNDQYNKALRIQLIV